MIDGHTLHFFATLRNRSTVEGSDGKLTRRSNALKPANIGQESETRPAGMRDAWECVHRRYAMMSRARRAKIS